jgi:hypothetical protein
VNFLRGLWARHSGYLAPACIGLAGARALVERRTARAKVQTSPVLTASRWFQARSGVGKQGERGQAV